MVARHTRPERCKPLRLAYKYADGVRGRKLELEHFLGQNGVDICPLSETYINPEKAFQLANYVCQRKDSPTLGAAQPSCSAVV